jgi:bifunctional non-homologous end joining protein LigD
VWDLDPGERVSWSQVVAAAIHVRDVLSALGLQTWVKTTGGRGLHVVMPIRRHRNWTECLSFAKNIAHALERTDPTAYTTAFPKAGRASKILIDYLRNAHGATAIAAYSVRARKGAPIAAPLDWSALDEDIRFDFFNARSLATLLERKDPWRDFAKVRQSVTAAMRKRVAA